MSKVKETTLDIFLAKFDLKNAILDMMNDRATEVLLEIKEVSSNIDFSKGEDYNKAFKEKYNELSAKHAELCTIRERIIYNSYL